MLTSMDLSTAKVTTTPYAAFSVADPRCEYGACYFGTKKELLEYVKDQTEKTSEVSAWKLNRNTGEWQMIGS